MITLYQPNLPKKEKKLKKASEEPLILDEVHEEQYIKKDFKTNRF